MTRPSRDGGASAPKGRAVFGGSVLVGEGPGRDGWWFAGVVLDAPVVRLVVVPRGLGAGGVDAVRMAVRAGRSGPSGEVRWSAWFPLLPERPESAPTDDGGTLLPDAVLNVDTLEAGLGFDRFEIALGRTDGATTPPASEVGWAGWGSEAGRPRPFARPPRPRLVAVPFRSQRGDTAVPSDSVCLATSLAMVMARGGVEESTAAVARRGYDPVNGIWGNWLRACLTAEGLGFRARVEAMDRLGDLLPWLDRGVAPIVSVAFGEGELEGAPVPSTKGHLMVVRGVSSEGRVLVCDPAGRTAAEGVVSYDASQFARAWKGVAILVEAPRRRR